MVAGPAWECDDDVDDAIRQMDVSHDGLMVQFQQEGNILEAAESLCICATGALIDGLVPIHDNGCELIVNCDAQPPM